MRPSGNSTDPYRARLDAIARFVAARELLQEMGVAAPDADLDMIEDRYEMVEGLRQEALAENQLSVSG